MHRSMFLLTTAALFVTACGDDSITTPPVSARPSIMSTSPSNTASNVARNAEVRATFSEPMAPLTINGTSFTVRADAVPVAGVVTYHANVATFTPDATLAANTTYTATMSIAAEDVGGDAMVNQRVWTFTTVASSLAGPAALNLGTAGNYVILGKSAVSTTGATAITGNVGLSPAAATFITGFSLSAPAGTFTTSALVTGQVFAANYTAPTPASLTTSVLNMQAAYTDAAGRTLPDFIDLGAGNVQGMALVPGLYRWGTGLSIPSAVTLVGGANDVWIFQIAQNLTVGNGAIVTLSGGAQARNVFWQVAGQATLGTTSDFKGIILSKTLISFGTGSALVGRALAQTAVTLNATTITAP